MPGIRISLVLRWMTSGYAGRVYPLYLVLATRCAAALVVVFLIGLASASGYIISGTAYLELAILPPIYESRLFRFADRPPTRIGCIIIN